MSVSRMSHAASVYLGPGETVQVVLGGSGSVLTGNVSSAGIVAPIDWQTDFHTLTLEVPGDPKYVSPARETFESDAAYAEALAQQVLSSQTFWESDAGRTVKRLSRQYVLSFNADGKFTVPDVLPGTYELLIAPTRATTNSTQKTREPLGRLVTTVIVPESSNGGRIDLGRLELKPEVR